MSQRTRRVDELLREEISAVIRREVDDPRIGLRDDHGRRCHARPAPRHRVGVDHRHGRRAPAEPCARWRARCRSCARGWARCASSASRSCTCARTTAAKRGTRVLQLLDELERGEDADGVPVGETLPTPKQAGRPRLPSRPSRWPRREPSQARRPRHGRSPRDHAKRHVPAAVSTPRLTPADLEAVPAAVVARLTRRTARAHRLPRDPEADALGSALAVALAVEQLGGRATPSAPTRCQPMYDFMPHIDRFRQAPDPRSTTTSSSSATAATWSASVRC